MSSEDLDEGIQGFIWIRSEFTIDMPGLYEGECISYVPFTSRRVEE